MTIRVTTNKLAAAYRANGETIYVLFEQTYDKEYHPHNPQWSATSIGPIDVTIKNWLVSYLFKDKRRLAETTDPKF